MIKPERIALGKVSHEPQEEGRRSETNNHTKAVVIVAVVWIVPVAVV